MNKRSLKSTGRSKPAADGVDLVQLALEESLSIVDRFSAEPVFGPMGKGYLKSAGVTELQALKEGRRRKR